MEEYRVLTKKCSQCGRDFTGTLDHGRDAWRKRKYCSTDCKKKAQTGHQTAPILTKRCEYCDGRFYNRRPSGRTIEPYKWATTRFCSPEHKQAFQKGKSIPWLNLIKEDPEERFWRFVDKISNENGRGCWVWTGRKSKKGYGEFELNGQKRLAHRVSWELANGPIPEGSGFHGTEIRHTCDTPQCVRPEHLITGTHLQNMQDREERGRRVAPTGSAHGMAKITELQAIAIKAMWAAGGRGGAEIGALFGVSASTVSLIVNEKNWTHI